MPFLFVRPTTLVFGCLLVAGSSFAKTPIQEREPGLWEITMSQDSPLAAMLQSTVEAFKHMPEAQRKQMEQMMAQSGMSMTQPNVIRQCVTPEMAKREFEPTVDDPDMKCSDVKWSDSRDEGRYSMTCTNADGKWTVDGRIWDATAKSFKSEMTMTGKVSGETVNMKIAQEARWVSADCQGVQPVE